MHDPDGAPAVLFRHAREIDYFREEHPGLGVRSLPTAMTPDRAAGRDAGALERAQLAAHRFGMPVASLLMATLFFVSWRDGFPDTVEAIGTPVLALLFAAGAAVAWVGGRPSRRFERAVMAAALLVLVGAAFDSALARRWEFGYPYVLGYLPLAYTSAFLLFGLRWGTIASAALFAGTAAATLLAVGTGEIHLARGIPILAASPILIGLLYALSWSSTAAARAQVEAQHAAATDPLTGAWNRRSGEEALDRARGVFALLVVDLDDFKRVNDERGHAAGDAVLRRTASAIRRAVRPDDRVVRWGGDEFVVVAPGVGGDDARTLAGRIAASVTQAAAEDGVRASVGVAVREGDEPWQRDLRPRRRGALRRQAPASGRHRRPGGRAVNPTPLPAALARVLAGAAGTTAVVAHRLDGSGPRFEAHGDRPFALASVMKLPLLVHLLRRADAGTLDLDARHVLDDADRLAGSGVLHLLDAGLAPTVRDLLRLMMVVSDNQATDALLARITLDAVEREMHALGYPSVRLPHPVRAMLASLTTLGADAGYAAMRAAFRDPDRPTPADPEGASPERGDRATPGDLARLLVDLHAGRLLSPAATALACTILEDCQTNARIPADLPKGVRVGHKTGTLPGRTNDVGVVHAPSGPFVLVLMNEGETDERRASQVLARAARWAYDAFEADAPAAR